MKAVYQLTNKKNGRTYIGSSSNIAHHIMQWKDWKNCCSNPLLRKDLEQVGYDGFQFDIVFECPSGWTKKMVEDKEYEYIHTCNPFYNTIGKSRPEEVRKKLSIANMGKRQSAEVKAKRHTSIMIRHKAIPQTNFSHCMLYWVSDMNMLCVGADAVSKLIGCNKEHVTRSLKKSIYNIKGHNVTYFSVETSGDECNRVGMRMSDIPKCEAPIEGEEIVHSWTMIKPRGNDKGVIDLCYRSGEVTYINAEVVHEKDEFDYAYGLDPFLTHKPYDGAGDPGKAIKYYAVFKTKNGASLFKVWAYDKVLDHAKRFSKSYFNGTFQGPWSSDFDAMAKKTVLLDVLNYAPKKSDFARAIAAEGSVKSVITKDMSTVNDESTIDVVASESPLKDDSVTAPTDKESTPTPKANGKKDKGEDLFDVQ